MLIFLLAVSGDGMNSFLGDRDGRLGHGRGRRDGGFGRAHDLGAELGSARAELLLDLVARLLGRFAFAFRFAFRRRFLFFLAGRLGLGAGAPRPRSPRGLRSGGAAAGRSSDSSS